MTHVCPHCEWPEFTPVYEIQQASVGIFGNLFRKTGKVVHCTRCAEQYAIGATGAYRIKPGAARPQSDNAPPGRPEKAKPMPAVDEDTAELWK
jgi:hypothetical protein